MKNTNQILKGASVLLIAVVMILSTVSVTANTKTTNTKVVEPYSTTTKDIIFEDGFESYDEFVLDFPPWTQYDGDGGPTYQFTDFTYPETPYTGSYMIFNPYYTEPPVDWYAHTGDQYAACFSSTVLPNDDWMITPQLSLTENCQISFWASTIYDGYGYERFKVGVSTTDTDPESFTIITPGDYVEVNQYPGWFEYSYSLSNYDNTDVYIAIICCSYDAFILGIDDVVVSSGVEPPDLDCDGSLSWTDVEPGAIVTGTFTVENTGNEGSLLDWEIESYPDWGTWTFDPDGGTDLPPGSVTVDVEVVAPDDEETNFTGEIVLVNSEDPEDTCTIDVALVTPVSQQSLISLFFEKLAERFPFLALVLEVIF